MTTRRIHDNIIGDLKARMATLEKKLNQVTNNPTVAVPIRAVDHLPPEGAEGEIVLGENGTAYKYQDGAWDTLSGTATFQDVISTPGKLSVFEGVARSYQNTSGTILLVHCSVGVPAEGADILITVKKNGLLFANGTITQEENVGTFIPDDGTFVADDYFTQDIDQIGEPGTTGRDLVVKLF